jgi:hypothetical protein
VWLDLSQKEEVYEQYKQFMRRAGFTFDQGIMGYSGFVRVWKNHFPWLHTSENKKIKSKCMVCEDLEVGLYVGIDRSIVLRAANRSSIEPSTSQNLLAHERDPSAIGALRLLQYDHLLFQQEERQQYYKRRQESMTQPHLSASLIFDGMTQATCEIPKKNKYEYPETKLKQKLVGVLYHGSDE